MAHLGPSLAKLTGSNLANIGLNSVEIAPTRPNIGLVWPEFERNRHELAEFGPNLAKFARSWSNSSRHWPSSGEIRPGFSRIHVCVLLTLVNMLGNSGRLRVTMHNICRHRNLRLSWMSTHTEVGRTRFNRPQISGQSWPKSAQISVESGQARPKCFEMAQIHDAHFRRFAAMDRPTDPDWKPALTTSRNALNNVLRPLEADRHG